MKLFDKEPYLGVIINVSSKEVSTLALFSALKYTKFPILLVNCDMPGTDDYTYFKELNKVYDFELVNWPLLSHGQTLDKIFTTYKAENILCIDSDVEILNSEIIDFCVKYIDYPNVFGTGFLQFAEWDIQPSLNFKNIGFSMERPYMPLVLLKRQLFADLINEGFSFDIVDINNNPTGNKLKKIYLKLINRLINKIKFDSVYFKLNNLFYNSDPYRIKYDTGAKIHNYLRFEKRLDFVGLPHRLQNLYINHFHGITRYLLNPNDSFFTSDIKEKVESVKESLKTKYNFE